MSRILGPIFEFKYTDNRPREEAISLLEEPVDLLYTLVYC